MNRNCMIMGECDEDANKTDPPSQHDVSNEDKGPSTIDRMNLHSEKPSRAGQIKRSLSDSEISVSSALSTPPKICRLESGDENSQLDGNGAAYPDENVDIQNAHTPDTHYDTASERLKAAYNLEQCGQTLLEMATNPANHPCLSQLLGLDGYGTSQSGYIADSSGNTVTYFSPSSSYQLADGTQYLSYTEQRNNTADSCLFASADAPSKAPTSAESTEVVYSNHNYGYVVAQPSTSPLAGMTGDGCFVPGIPSGSSRAEDTSTSQMAAAYVHAAGDCQSQVELPDTHNERHSAMDMSVSDKAPIVATSPTTSGRNTLSTWKIRTGGTHTSSSHGEMYAPVAATPCNATPQLQYVCSSVPNRSLLKMPKGNPERPPSSSSTESDAGVIDSSIDSPEPRTVRFSARPTVSMQGGSITPNFVRIARGGMVAPLNSSGSDEAVSPADVEYYGIINRTPYNTPVEGMTTSTPVHPMPRPDQLTAALRMLRPDEAGMSSDPNETGRHQHNAKERARRARIKSACENLKDLIPGMTCKTDKATVFDFAVRYIQFLQSITGPDRPYYDRRFLKQEDPYSN